MVVDERLHLPSLVIENFRGIESLTLPRLGRVTLLTGKNGVGKTTVLDAVQAYAAQGYPPVLHELLLRRREFSIAINENGDPFTTPDWSALFYGRSISDNIQIIIGPRKRRAQIKQIKITKDSLPDELESRRIGLHSQIIRRVSADEYPPNMIDCERLGPGLPNDERMAVLWDEVALTDDENRALQALRLVYPDAERVAVIGGGARFIRAGGRRVVARIKGLEHPTPLRSLGDGAVRLFGLALALANSQKGFLVIDEAENGIHHSIQRDYWRMVLQTAYDNKVQVLATTHSWDCVRAFARAAEENKNVKGVLIRLEQDKQGHYIVDYPEDELNIASTHGIEVR